MLRMTSVIMRQTADGWCVVGGGAGWGALEAATTAAAAYSGDQHSALQSHCGYQHYIHQPPNIAVLTHMAFKCEVTLKS